MKESGPKERCHLYQGQIALLEQQAPSRGLGVGSQVSIEGQKVENILEINFSKYSII